MPDGVSPEDWTRVKAALADHPQRQAELQRIGRLLSYQAAVRQFQQARSGGTPAAVLRTQAEALDASLDEHLANGETNAGEAMILKGALLEQLVADPAARATTLAAWKQVHAAATTATPDPRDATYLREQRAVVAAWVAQPAAQRSDTQLTQQLGALRARIYAGGSAAGGHGDTGGTSK